MNIIPYGRQTITQDDLDAVTSVLQSDFLTQGPAVETFEKDFAAYVGSAFAVAVANGTAALHIAAIALGLKPGQKVLTTPLTFVASSNCVRFCGGDVDFVDIDPQTLNIDLTLLEKKLEAAAKGTYSGIIPVSFAGLPVDVVAIRKLADKHGLWVLEDACHAPGGEYADGEDKWRKVGCGLHSDVSVFSFHPVKHIACGEGGMITTNNRDVYKKLLKLRSHGITRDPKDFQNNDGGWYYEMQELGFNYRLPDILCALGTSQLKKIHESVTVRNEIADYYRSALAGTSIEVPATNPKFRHAYHLFVVQVDHRKQVYDFLRTKGIYAQIHYLPVHMHPYYRNLYGEISLPVSERYYKRCLSVPMYPALKEADLKRVVSSLREAVEVSRG